MGRFYRGHAGTFISIDWMSHRISGPYQRTSDTLNLCEIRCIPGLDVFIHDASGNAGGAAPAAYAGVFNLSVNIFRNFATLGATTNAQ